MSSQRPGPSQNSQRRDEDFPPLPPHRRLEQLLSLPTPRAHPPPPPRRHLWEVEPDIPRTTQQDPDEAEIEDILRFARREMTDRNFQAEYDELLGNFVGNTLSELAPFMSGPEYNPNLDRTRNRSAAANVLETLQRDQREEDDSRRPATQLPPVFGYRTVRSLSGRQRLDGTEDDLEAVRALWNRRAQYSSSPFSPPRMPPNLSPRNLSPLPHSEEYPEENRRVKRRKLDSEKASQTFKGFRYGWYGQVEPGQLKMEIMSCDGGLFENAPSYAHENILRDDKTVYCTQSNRCNIVLKHQGCTAFSLKELVIKAPASNYSSPVREGMVFVSMNQDEIMTRTAAYEIQYAPLRSGRAATTRPLAPIISIRHHEDGTTVTRTHTRQRRLYSLGAGEDEENEQRTAQIPAEFTSQPPLFNVTTECSYEETDDEDTPRISVNRRAPNRIGSLPFESDSSDDGNPFASDEYGFEDSFNNRRRDPSGGMSLAEAVEADQMATQEAVRAVGGELMAPHAKFFIEKDKSKCTIRFDPPVSGRFILLKMWSSSRASGSNIDIQAVLAKGFAGPRYFPSVELR